MKILAITLCLALAFAADKAEPQSAEKLVKKFNAKIGDTVVFDIPAPKDDNHLNEWVFLDSVLGREGDFWQLTGDTMKVEEDGTRTWSYSFKITKAGQDTLSFVYGDVSKLDDAMRTYHDQTFTVADMNGTQYAQVEITAA